jgi:thiol-disulfide isomerase/thioredoxin
MKRIIRIAKVLLIVILTTIFALFIATIVYNRMGNNLIKVEIKGIGTKLYALSYASNTGQTDAFKIALCVNNKIRINVPIQEICGAKIHFRMKNSGSRANQIRFYLEPNEDIIINGVANDNSIDYDAVKGNTLSLQYIQLQKELLPLFIKEFELKTKLRQNQQPDIKRQFDSLIQYSIPQKKLEYVKKHLDYELSADILSEDKYVSHDTIAKYSNQLTENVKKHIFGITLFNLIEGWNSTKADAIAPIFSQTTFLGNKFALDELTGKYVVLDFWGSWFVWCIKDFPKMKEYYNKYKGKVEYVGIACYDSKSHWENAIEKNQLDWINILNDKNVNDISIKYAVSTFPTKIIINKEGRIIKKVVGESLEFYHIIDSLMSIKQ